MIKLCFFVFFLLTRLKYIYIKIDSFNDLLHFVRLFFPCLACGHGAFKPALYISSQGKKVEQKRH